MRKLSIDITEILNLISCAEDYGFSDDVLFTYFASFLGDLSNEEIEEYCSYYTSNAGREAGYNEEDYEEVKEKLQQFKEDYFI